MLKKFHDPVIELEFLAFIVSLVGESDQDPPVQESKLPEPVTENAVLKLRGGKDLPVGLERGSRSRLVRGICPTQWSLCNSRLVLLVINMSVAIDLDLSPG